MWRRVVWSTGTNFSIFSVKRTTLVNWTARCQQTATAGNTTGFWHVERRTLRTRTTSEAPHISSDAPHEAPHISSDAHLRHLTDQVMHIWGTTFQVMHIWCTSHFKWCTSEAPHISSDAHLRHLTDQVMYHVWGTSHFKWCTFEAPHRSSDAHL
jgi:hypothetical protein